jgi:long-chain acyl-CoA synthetase
MTRVLEHFPNLVTMFFTRATERGDAPFLWAKRQGKWTSTSWREAAEAVSSLAAALKRIGLAPGETVMLVSENRPEWCIADLAIMAAGCVTVPTYITNTTRDHQHILDDSGARAVIVSSAKLAKTLLPAVLRTSGCEHVIGIEPIRSAQTSGIIFHDWDGLIAAEKPDVAACAAGAGFAREDLACIIYTSGTGGAPRGRDAASRRDPPQCRRLHRRHLERLRLGRGGFLSFLPASHAYEHSGGQFFPIALGAGRSIIRKGWRSSRPISRK